MRYWVIAPWKSDEREMYETAWAYDLKNGTIAIGWYRVGDVSQMSREDLSEAIRKIRQEGHMTHRESYVLNTIWKFYNEISKGDIVIARKGVKEIVGIGKVIGKAFHDENKGKERMGGGHKFCPHFLKIEWQNKHIVFDRVILSRNTISELPPEKYQRLIENRIGDVVQEEVKFSAKEVLKEVPQKQEKPEWLLGIIDDIEILKKDPEHKERAHESLVEAFYELLGFTKYTDIKHRQGRIDITIEHENKKLIVNEVKKNWYLSWKDRKALSQAYNYALETGVRYVVLTNGDYYAVFDRDKEGRSYESQFAGDFKLSRLTKENLSLINKLKKENICV